MPWGIRLADSRCSAGTKAPSAPATPGDTAGNISAEPADAATEPGGARAVRTGIVEVRAAAARNLPRMDSFGSCDAFLRLSLCGETRETSVRGRRKEGGVGTLPSVLPWENSGVGRRLRFATAARKQQLLATQVPLSQWIAVCGWRSEPLSGFKRETERRVYAR